MSNRPTGRATPAPAGRRRPRGATAAPEGYPAAAAVYEDLDAIIERFGEDLDDDTDLASLD